MKNGVAAKIEKVNSVDTDGYELSHLDLHCLQSLLLVCRAEIFIWFTEDLIYWRV